MSDRPYLDALAERCGVERTYIAYDGGVRFTPDTTRETLLAALGFDASSEASAAQALHTLDLLLGAPGLAPVRVVRAGSRELAHVELRLPSGASGKLRYRLELRLEAGARYSREGEVHAAAETLSLAMPAVTELEFGYHELECSVELDADDFVSTADLIVAPPSSLPLFSVLGERRAIGVWGHLYSVHSERSAGIGDLSDLRELCRWAANLGFEFVGINPLHAADNLGAEVSPYFPLSRLYRNPIYLDVDAVVARTQSAQARALLTSPELQGLRAELQARTRVAYASTWQLKRRVLAVAHREFAAQQRGRSTELGRAYEAYRRREGRALHDFATFCALHEHMLLRDSDSGDFRAWPEPLRDARSAAVAQFARAEAEAIDFHAYLQFELDVQLKACQRAASDSGMAIGLYGDLALGDAPFSADVWAAPELYTRGVSVGAPPDPYSDSGQQWGLVPFNPLALRADRYRTCRRLLGHAFRHMGALRIDHVMGLARQFFVPAGMQATQGGYVRFPEADLLGIVALESRRARALVVGEDLGVVPAGLREQMAENAVLRSQVLYFERDANAELLSPRRYARRALATVSTHDLPPLPGFFAANDLRLRRRAGNIASDDALERALREREHQKASLLRLLRREGLLAEMAGEPPIETLCAAVQLLIAGAASRLIGLALDDLTLEHEALNTPATQLPGEPNWSRRSSLSLEQLARDDRIRELLAKVLRRAQSA